MFSCKTLKLFSTNLFLINFIRRQCWGAWSCSTEAELYSCARDDKQWLAHVYLWERWREQRETRQLELLQGLRKRFLDVDSCSFAFQHVKVSRYMHICICGFQPMRQNAQGWSWILRNLQNLQSSPVFIFMNMTSFFKTKHKLLNLNLFYFVLLLFLLIPF